MYKLSIIFTIFFSLCANANYSYTDININELEAQKVISNQIQSDRTCLDEYLQRQSELKKFLIWAPPIALVATPTATLVGAYGSLTIASIFTSGWDQLGYMILGGLGSGVAVAGTFIFKQTSKGIEFANTKRMSAIITAAHSRNYQNKKYKKFVKRYNRKYSAKPKTQEELADHIIDLDESGDLCNGKVRGYINPKNLKYSLAKRRHLMKYIFYTE